MARIAEKKQNALFLLWSLEITAKGKVFNIKKWYYHNKNNDNNNNGNKRNINNNIAM